MRATRLAIPDVVLLEPAIFGDARGLGRFYKELARTVSVQGRFSLCLLRLGLPERRVILRYALRNALAPSVQVLAQNLQYLVGGVIVVEAVFAYPGIGTQLVSAVQNRDVTVVQSVAMLIAVFYVVINLLADLVVMLLVPKLREPV